MRRGCSVGAALIDTYLWRAQLKGPVWQVQKEKKAAGKVGLDGGQEARH